MNRNPKSIVVTRSGPMFAFQAGVDDWKIQDFLRNDSEPDNSYPEFANISTCEKTGEKFVFFHRQDWQKVIKNFVDKPIHGCQQIGDFRFVLNVVAETMPLTPAQILEQRQILSRLPRPSRPARANTPSAPQISPQEILEKKNRLKPPISLSAEAGVVDPFFSHTKNYFDDSDGRNVVQPSIPRR